MPIRVYQIASVATGTAAAAASLPIVRPGTLVAVQITARMAGGASSGIYDFGVTINQPTGNFEEINNPPREVMLARAVFLVNFGAQNAFTGPISPANLALRVGDTIYLSQTQVGTAAASGLVAVQLFVQEGA